MRQLGRTVRSLLAAQPPSSFLIEPIVGITPMGDKGSPAAGGGGGRGDRPRCPAPGWPRCSRPIQAPPPAARRGAGAGGGRRPRRGSRRLVTERDSRGSRQGLGGGVRRGRAAEGPSLAQGVHAKPPGYGPNLRDRQATRRSAAVALETLLLYLLHARACAAHPKTWARGVPGAGCAVPCAQPPRRRRRGRSAPRRCARGGEWGVRARLQSLQRRACWLGEFSTRGQQAMRGGRRLSSLPPCVPV